VSAALDLGDGTADGTASMQAHDARVRVGDRVMVGDLSVVLRARARAGATDLAGSWARFREHGDDGWWMQLELPQASLTSREGERLRAGFLLRARDVTPLAGLIEGRASLAGQLALRTVPSSPLSATGEIVAALDGLDVRDVVARTGWLGLDLEGAIHGSRSAVALLLVGGPLDFGVGMDGGQGAKVVLVGARPWFVARRASIRAMERGPD